MPWNVVYCHISVYQRHKAAVAVLAAALAVMLLFATPRDVVRPVRAEAAACPLPVLGEPADGYERRICAALAAAAADLPLIDAVRVAPASGDGMRWPVNPEAGDALNCGEAPRGVRTITVRDHPSCKLYFHIEHMVLHELGHKVWEERHREPYGPRWQEEEAWAEEYAALHGYPW